MKMSVDGTLACWYVVFFVTYQCTNVPSAYTCISIQMVRWYVGMLRKTHPKGCPPAIIAQFVSLYRFFIIATYF